jgi:hypothetical protein
MMLVGTLNFHAQESTPADGPLPVADAAASLCDDAQIVRFGSRTLCIHHKEPRRDVAEIVRP